MKDFIFKNENVNDLQNKISAIIEQGKMKAMGKNSFLMIQKFSLKRTVEAFEDAFCNN